MSVELHVANLLRLARIDLDAALLLNAAGNRNASYHNAQAAEKVIRSVLTSEGKHAGIGHKLNEMVDLVPDANPIKPLLRSIEHLAAFATTFRYPTSSGRIKPPPTADEIKDDISKVDAALQDAAKRFGVDLASANAPASRPGPAR